MPPIDNALLEQALAHIQPHVIDAHLRYLAHPLLEGRAPATRGGRLTAEYLAGQLRESGVEPGVNGSYFQRVPIDIVGADPATIRVTASGRATANLRYPEDVVVWAGSAAGMVALWAFSMRVRNVGYVDVGWAGLMALAIGSIGARITDLVIS